MKSLFMSTGTAGLALALASCGPDEESAADPEVRLASVEVLEVEPAAGYPIQEKFVGMVEARRRSDLAFELAGTIEEVNADEGESLKAGAVLARIDTSRLEARRDELQAALTQANATRDLATKVLARLEKLVDRGGVSVQELDEATERVAAASAGVSQIEAQLVSVEVDLGKSILRAPYDGTVARRMIDEGTVVSPNELVFQWLEATELEIRVGMATDAVSALKPGGTIKVMTEAGEQIELSVLRILPQRDRATRTVDVILAAPAKATSLRDGDLVSALRTANIEESGFFLPRDALTESVRGLWACYVAIPDSEAGPEAHRLDRRDLEVIHEYSDRVFVRGAISDGDWVLQNGLQKVAPGQRVKIIQVNRRNPDPETREKITALD